jgi:hypothetical protein
MSALPQKHAVASAETIWSESPTPTGPELWPPNVARLRELGIPFEWRRIHHDIVIACPRCSGRFLVHESADWHLCLGNLGCRADRVPFPALMATLADTARGVVDVARRRGLERGADVVDRFLKNIEGNAK